MNKLRLEWVEAGTLARNPANWRRHPDGQKAALSDVLNDPDVGWAGALLYNERTHRLIDGHGRLEVVAPDAVVPVLIGDWSEAAEKKILLTLDPLASMATADVDQLSALLEDVDLDTPALAELGKSLEKYLAPAGDGGDVAESAGVTPGAERYMIVVTCRDEMHQADLLDRFMQDGLQVKALVG